jgi:uncharacterized protein YbjT (DUF2867 family)
MHVVIIGGNGRTALLLGGLLTAAGHQVTGTIRDPAQEPRLAAAGMRAAVADLERAATADLATVLTGGDAVVYAAGAGTGSSAERTTAIDRDAAVHCIDAAQIAAIPRFVLISSWGAGPVPPEEPSGLYLTLKGEADDYLRSRDLDWTVLRPTALTDDPGTGRIRVGTGLPLGSIPRADVAALLARLLTHSDGLRRQFEVTSGEEDLTTVPL